MDDTIRISERFQGFTDGALGGYRWRQDIGAAEGLGTDWFTGEAAGFAALWASHSPRAWLG